MMGTNEKVPFENKNEHLYNLPTDINQYLHELNKEFGNSADIVIRRFELGSDKQISAALVYTDGLANNKEISDFFKVLLKDFPQKNITVSINKYIQDHLLIFGDVKEVHSKTEVYNEILRGSVAIIIAEESTTLIVGTKGWESRAIAEPENEMTIRGPREGFNENIRTNTALVRRKIPSTKLRYEQKYIGTLTETAVGIMYIKGIVNPKIVEEVKRRLNRIEIDSILESGYIEELIQDSTFSLFPTVYNTERPDKVASELLQGKVAIFVDGTPFVLIVPVSIAMYFQAGDDYYLRFPIGSFLRILRIATFFIATTLPSFYVAVTTYHRELIPTTLLVRLAAQREGIPFPAIIEAFLMEITFEILREAGLRMPKSIGQAVSIVGALVLGTAAVDAGIVSAAMVIIVAMTAISNFTTPGYDMAIASRIIRFILLVLAGTLGLFGMLFGLILFVIHLSSLRSFGIPYLAGIAPMNLSDQKDIFVRVPWFWMKRRPYLFSQKDQVREESTSPHPPKKNE